MLWREKLDRLPLAFVAQNGLEDIEDVPWDRIEAVFIGGDFVNASASALRATSPRNRHHLGSFLAHQGFGLDLAHRTAVRAAVRLDARGQAAQDERKRKDRRGGRRLRLLHPRRPGNARNSAHHAPAIKKINRIGNG